MPVIRSTKELKFLDSISYPEIEIQKDSFSFITGKSGCGKSTYLKMLNRTVIPSSGTIYYQEKEIREYPVLAYRKQILLVPQEVFLFDGTIRDNFHSYCEARETERYSETKIKKFLHICCADFDPDAECKTLSGGERQRVFLSIFLSCIPEVLLLDEPTAALDEKTSVELLSNIKKFCRQEHITAACVCHNEDLSQKFSDSIIRLGGEK